MTTVNVDPKVLKLYQEIRADKEQMVELKATYDETGNRELLEKIQSIARSRTSKLLTLNSSYGALSNHRKGI